MRQTAENGFDWLAAASQHLARGRNIAAGGTDSALKAVAMGWKQISCAETGHKRTTFPAVWGRKGKVVLENFMLTRWRAIRAENEEARQDYC